MAFDFLAKPLLHILLLTIVLLIVVNAFVNALLTIHGPLVGSTKIFVGLPWMNKIYFTTLSSQNYSFRVESIQINFCRGLVIHLNNVHCCIDAELFTTVPAGKRTEKSWSIINPPVGTVLRKLRLNKVKIHNLRIKSSTSNKSIKCELLEVVVVYEAKHLNIDVSASRLREDTKVFSIRSLDYELHLELNKSSSGQSLFFWDIESHSHVLEFRGLKAYAGDTAERPHPRLNLKNFTSLHLNEGLKGFVTRMNSFVLRFDQVSVTFNENISVISSNVFLSCQLIPPWDHEIHSKISADLDTNLMQKVTVSVNSTVCRNEQDIFLHLPSVTLTSVTSLAFMSSSSRLSHLSSAVTLAIVDPLVNLTQSQLHALWYWYSNKHDEMYQRSCSNGSEALDPHIFVSFVAKAIISNFTLNLQLEPNEKFLIRVANVHLSGRSHTNNEITSASRDSTRKILKNARDSVDDFLKIDKFVLTYSCDNQNASKLHEVPVLVFTKWEFFTEHLFSSENEFTSTLRNLRISLEHLEVLNSFHRLMTALEAILKLRSNKIRKMAPATFSLKLRLKNASATISTVQRSRYLSALGNASPQLTEFARGASMDLTEAFFVVSGGKKRLDIVHGSLTRIFEDSCAVTAFDQIVCLENFVLEISDRGYFCRMPACKLSMDVYTIWLFFYMRDIAMQLLCSDESTVPMSPQESFSSLVLTQTLKNCNFEIDSLLFEVDLPHCTKLLFTLKLAAFNGNSMNLSAGITKAFTKSVYGSDDVLVPILSLDNLSTNLMYNQQNNVLKLHTDSIWASFEYHLRLYMIFDNLCSMVKCYKLFSSSFENLASFQIPEPIIEEPSLMYPVDISTDSVLLNVEEDLFEQELGLIFKVGVSEQQERMEKLRIFEEELNSSSASPLSNKGSKLHTLFEHFSTSWINRIKKARLLFFEKPFVRVKAHNIGSASFKVREGLNNTILKFKVENMSIRLRPPSFSLDNCYSFLNKHGKGIPRTTKFTTLIPLSIELLGDSLQIILRDYPLPIVFLPTLKLSGDLIFAERMPLASSKRYVHIPFVPAAATEPHSNTDSIFGSRIIRTLNPLKVYMNLKIEVESTMPTTITWGKSLQPGCQAVMIWFDYLTKPPLDPSPKLGFWDKFRLLVHGKLIFEWKGSSELHLNIKGSHNPYLITDKGAGLSFCWKGNARLAVHEDSDPIEFLKIKSEQFLLAIRDFTHPRRLEKAIMKLSGNVTWCMGFTFESGNLKEPGSTRRSSSFKPHYRVNLCNPEFLDPDSSHDSYDGFRSDFIHLFFRVVSETGEKYSNKVYLAPHCMTHFFSWWNLFSTYTSGPIRQGSLFPDLVQNPKKFSKALFTVKYEVRLAPLVVSHTYRHVDSHLIDRKNDGIAFTTMKGKFDSLRLDLHQKRVKMTHLDNKLKRSRTVWKFKMNAGEVDCVGADFRLAYSMFKWNVTPNIPQHQVPHSTSGDYRNNGQSSVEWFDIEDYSDVNQAMYIDTEPLEFEDSPLLFSPRISYMRDTGEGAPLEFPFGLEEDHNCSIGNIDPMATQEYLARERAHELESQLSALETLINQLDCNDDGADELRQRRLDIFETQLEDFRHRLRIIHKVLEYLRLAKLPSNSLVSDDIESNLPDTLDTGAQEISEFLTNSSFTTMGRTTSAFEKSSFDNKFIFHNILLKVNSRTRDLLLDYTFNVLNRRKSTFFQTYKAVALLDELLKVKIWTLPSADLKAQSSFVAEDSLSNADLMDYLDEIIREVAGSNLKAFDTYQIKLVSPQIQITSKEVPRKCILVTANEIETSVIGINQMAQLSNQSVPLDVNSLVETRYATKLRDAHFFIFDREMTSSDNGLGFQTGGYGTDPFSSYWPPWLPMEMCYNRESLKDCLFLTRNDMTLHFTQPNSLFFQDKAKSIQRSETKVRVGFPNLTLACNPNQYSSIYAIATELLHFASSFDKKADKLSKVLLAEEVRNSLDELDGSMIVNIQNCIKNLHRSRSYLRLHDAEKYQEVAQRIALELDAAVLELNVLMSAIKNNYDKYRASDKQNSSQGTIYWQIGADKVTWKLLDSKDEDFVLFELGSTSFLRSQSLEGTNSNKLTISSLKCINLQERAVYRDLLSSYDESMSSMKPLIELKWTMGPPIGGISDVIELIVLLEPFTFKMDHVTLDTLFKYFLPARINNVDSTAVYPDRTYSFSNDTGEGSVILGLNRRLPDTASLKSVSPLPNSRGSPSVSPLPTPTLFRKVGEGMNEMVDRSSRYFSVRSATIRKVTVTISYKGSRSLLTNVSGLTVKVPTLKYKNRLWSREEFVATLKKDFVKVVLQHTGNIIGNKLVRHKSEQNVHSFESPQSSRFPAHIITHGPHGPSSLRKETSLGEYQSISTEAGVAPFFPLSD
ncbi:LADA_0H09758g1_1 [Lachancea dasiensis]|uniref:LADA_0H09758g1_1 n=1 Tax=Lachancea dasiensis TaxID=1072105 RepID=A0A1G4K2W7_9SACH|nr:LADA_0H09758g1_1 [Lachancea dasiensis]